MTEPLDDARELDEVLKAFGRATTQTQIDYPQRLEAIMKVEKFLQKLRAAPARCDAESVELQRARANHKDLVTTKRRTDARLAIALAALQKIYDESCEDNITLIAGDAFEDATAEGSSLVPPPSEAGREELREALDHMHDARLSSIHAKTEVARLRQALEPFAINVGAVSLSKALGHITREHLLAARAALSPDPGTVAVASAQYRCTCGAEPYCAPNVHAASCPLAVTSTHRGGAA